MADLLLELFSEEIPARMQEKASEYLFATLTQNLVDAGLKEHQNLPTYMAYVTPRRVAVIIKGILTEQSDTIIEKKGPKISAPKAAIDGFLKSSGLTLDELKKRMVGKDETYFAVIHKKGQSPAIILKEVIEKILNEFPWPKSMRWGSRDTSWVRPLHSILCLFDGKIVPVEFAGIKAGNTTRGHRFLAPDTITISNPDEYCAKLEKANVIPYFYNRRTKIQELANPILNKENLLINIAIPNYTGLLNEVTGLVEWPIVLLGAIDDKYMDLPQEVLVSEMRTHQKYISLLNKDGSFASKFLIVSNMITSDDGKAVIAGNERVLRARLSDGRFFFDQDRKKPLSEWAKGLAGVTFHAKIGTIAEKVDRIKKLAGQLVPYVESSLRGAQATKQSSLDRHVADATRDDELLNQVLRAAELCKADLVTGMVGEFPELQGVMGRYYALAQKEDAAVADAIRDHYLPLGPDSPVPTKPVSICIALADKLDTLVSMFAAGEKPTGSKDPFALRRSALGIIRIILENKLRLPLKKLLGDELLVFFSDRLKVQLKDQGIRHDVIDAVMAGGDDDLVRVVAKATALQDFLATDDGTNLLAGYKRAANIVGIEEKKDKQAYTGKAEATLLKESEEKNLFEMLEKTGPHANNALAKEDFAEAMAALAALRKPVDAFFERVMVNAEDKALRANRLNLLARIRATLDGIANFAVIEGETKEKKAA